MVKLQSLSNNIITILTELTTNARSKGLAMLLVNENKNPYDESLPTIDAKRLIQIGDSLCRIFPYPFDLEATVESGAFIRVYYPQFEFDTSETIANTDICIDIVVSKNLWLINSGDRASVRPYEIAGAIVDILGKNSVTGKKLGRTVRFEGGSHLSVNAKFDCISLYCSLSTIETR